jgi:cholesterol oxidase
VTDVSRYDVLVIGSGFGGSVTALRAAEKGYTVGVLEAGRRFEPDDLPRSSWDVRRFLWMPRLGCHGIQRLTLLRDVLVLSGAGVGGGSLVYANTLYEPLDDFWADPQWAGITDWRAELAPHFRVARAMLGAARVPADTPADVVIRRLGERLGVADTFHRADVGVFFGEPGVEVPDPYFGGLGPPRTGCTACGGCMVGCRHGAKGSLDRNYLWLAERLGVTIHAEREAIDVAPDPAGYAVRARVPGRRGHVEVFRAEQVVLAAGALGTLRLLLASRQQGLLPRLSARLGENVRTNSEAIVGATARSSAVDYSRGVAITSSIHPDRHTQIEPVRYPPRSNAMGLLATVLVDGGGSVPRQLRFLGRVVHHPVAFARSLSVRRWSERTIILLVMQSRRNALRVTLRRGRLTSEPGEVPAPSYLPVANEAARIVAELIDGQPGSAVNEVLFDVPTTAHLIGGACIGASAEEGVVDPYHRVYGHPGLHVVDGAAISANLGANPSLTITAQAERALALWPAKGEPDLRPPLGEGYARLVAAPAVVPGQVPDRDRTPPRDARPDGAVAGDRVLRRRGRSAVVQRHRGREEDLG